MNKEGSVYIDGVEGDHTEWMKAMQKPLPCNTLLVAFTVNNTDNEGKSGLLASLDNTWSTGDPGLKCTDDASVDDNNDWKYYSMYHCFIDH